MTKIDDAPRLQQPGEIGFAGKTVQDCSIHGAVLWCVCMRSSEEQAEMNKRERSFENAVLAAADALLKEKKFAVEYSGHGSKFVRNEVPELMTFEDAKQEVYRWFNFADTIGGQARVYDVETGRVIWWL